MSDLYDTHEQGERVKSWLRENGSAIVMGLVLAFALMFGFKQWQAWQTSKRQQASAEYQVMLSFIEAGNMDAAVPNYEVLKSEYPRSAYTSMAAMMMAKARLQAGQVDLAATELKNVMEKGQPEPMKVIARERLARLKVGQGEYDAALELLRDAPSETGFEALFAEIRGDIYLGKGDTGRAVEFYRLALENIEEGVGNRELLVIKLEALGETVEGTPETQAEPLGGEV
ncbi:MAG: tetratricopeptide repeat protein [Xanthomonadales bacterium]|nr:tetratricopeptide repeat protein [Xanthomonadales bacterium]